MNTIREQIDAQLNVLEMQIDGFCKEAYAKDLRIAELEHQVDELRNLIAPPDLRNSQGWRAVPIKHLAEILRLIDPPPAVVDGKTMVFVNPMAAQILTKISAEVRAMAAATPLAAKEQA